MKNLFNEIPKSEKQRILEMHKNKKVISEQPYMDDKTGVPGLEDDTKPSKEKLKYYKNTELLGSNLFKNGISAINKNLPEYKELIKKLKNLPNNTLVKVTGGASNVGTAQGFDNKALAKERANNFVKAAKEDGVNNVTWNTYNVVGDATKKNSPEAEKEQFVKVDWEDSGLSYKQETAIDNTSVDKKLGGSRSDGGVNIEDALYKMCLKNLTAKEFREIRDRFLKQGKVASRSIQN
jgi:hypothetical protein